MLFASPIAISFFCVFRPAGDCCYFHLFSCCRCASPHVFDPIFLFDFCCVDFFVCIVHEGDVAVLLAVCISVVSIFSFFFGASLTSFHSFLVSLFLLCFSALLPLPFFVADLCLLFVFSFRLDNEAEHFALSRSYHSFVFRKRSSPPGVSPCVCAAGSMFVFAKRRPGCPDSILNLNSLLLLKCNCLSKMFCTFFLGPLSISTSLLLFELWLLRIFVFLGWIFSPTFSRALLEFTHHFL